MTSEALLRAIGNISDNLIEGAEEPPVRRVNQWVRWGAMAAALVIVAGLAMAIPKLSPPVSGKSAESATMQEAVTNEEAPASAEGATETQEVPAEDEAGMSMTENAAEEPASEIETEIPMAERPEETDSANNFYADGALFALFHADSLELSPDRKGDTTVAVMPDTLTGMSLTDTADEYVYGDGQIIVTVTDTDMNTLENGYMSDFITDGERMYLTADDVSYIDGRAVCVAETTDGLAAQTIVTNGDTTMLVSVRFAADIDIGQAVSAIAELCTAIQ